MKTVDLQKLAEQETDGPIEMEYPEFPGLKMICEMNAPKEELVRNVRINTERGLPQVWPHQPNDTLIGIACGGPSLLDSLDAMADLIKDGGKVIALANTMHVLLENGIRPSGHILLDASQRNATFLRDVKGCTYFIASQCHPDCFDTLETFTEPDQRTFIWHAVNSADELSEIMDAHKEPWVRVCGGSTIALRSLQLLKVLGYHKFHMFGFDSCYLDDKHHAYAQPRADKFRTAKIVCNEREFTVAGWMIQQALEFIRFTKVMGHEMDLVVHGNGMIAHMIRTTRAKPEAA